MTTLAASTMSPATTSSSIAYERFAGMCAIASGAIGFLYAVAFVVLNSSLWSAVFLMVGGILASAVLVAIYQRLRQTEPSFALWALLLGLAGAIGAAAHGAYDLSNALHPPTTLNLDLPSQIDPRGLLTFGVTGLGLWVVAWLIGRGGQFPRPLGYVSYVLAALLIVIYLARLIVLDAGNLLVVGPAVLAGFIVQPAWYIWMGLSLLRER